jgi:hypothetical protein
VPDNRKGIAIDLVGQSGDVQGKVGHTVLATDCPVAIAVASQVRRVKAVVLRERFSNRIPVSSMITSTVNEQAGGLALIAPDDVVQIEALRCVMSGFWIDVETSPFSYERST